MVLPVLPEIIKVINIYRMLVVGFAISQIQSALASMVSIKSLH
jgi:hypothetical protein